jgi:hypothetical protein
LHAGERASGLGAPEFHFQRTSIVSAASVRIAATQVRDGSCRFQVNKNLKMGGLMRTFTLALLLLATLPAIAQDKETLYENDVEVRTVWTFKVKDAAVQNLMPAGWELNPPATGPSKGFNLGLVLINQTLSQDPEGKPRTAHNYAVLVAPAKKTGTDVAAQMVLAGFVAKDAVPGAYGVYGPAEVTGGRRQQIEAEGKAGAEESWQVRADDGSVLELQVRFVRGQPNRGKVEAKIYSAAKPDFYRIYRFEQAADLVRSTPTGVDRTSNISIKASGPKLTPLFDGSQQLISITSIPFYSRSIYLPVP